MAQPPKRPEGPSVFKILGPYRNLIILLAVLTVAANVFTLWVPKIISHAIDAYARRTLDLFQVAWELGGFGFVIFVLTFLQNIVQVYASEKVAKDLRNQLSNTISHQNHTYIQSVNPSRLLTNLTSDMDSVKLFVAQAVVSLISSIFLIIGASFLLLATNWKLGLAVLTIVPIIGITFFLTLRKVRSLFFKSREIIDRLNRVINESILGSALIRILNSRHPEYLKFVDANADARDLGLQIVKIFAGLIPAITFFASMASVIILALGGHYIINGSLSLGDFAAFGTYMGILIFPILIIGFMTNIIAQATASYNRIAEVLEAPVRKESGTLATPLKGNIDVKNITKTYGEKNALKDVSFSVKAGTKTAIIGPTAAGKTQLLYVLTGLLDAEKGSITYDSHGIHEYESTSFYRQIGLVFQDSIIFNMSLQENIAFNTSVSLEDMKKAVDTAELGDFINSLPNGLDTVISERGSTLSGGQKQRLMLARALALNPKVLLLDDFTARVDTVTEGKILQNLNRNYPELTLVSVTQKVASIEHYEQIILLMEGEVLASGTHRELIKTSPEYMQIYTTQQSTNTYEVHPE
jgi:ATP-binding cassette subfamily B protein